MVSAFYPALVLARTVPLQVATAATAVQRAHTYAFIAMILVFRTTIAAMHAPAYILIITANELMKYPIRKATSCSHISETRGARGETPSRKSKREREKEYNGISLEVPFDDTGQNPT